MFAAFELFSSIDGQDNPLQDITEHFKRQVHQSWKEYLRQYREQSVRLWDEFKRSIQSNNQFLFPTGLVRRIVPTTSISRLQQIWFGEKQSKWLTSDQCILLGGLMVNWIVEQQMERALNYLDQKKDEDFRKEMLNIRHTN